MLATSKGNPNGKAISWLGVRKIDGFVKRSASLFGLTVLSYKKPTFISFINADEKAARLNQLIKQKRNNRFAKGSIEFSEIASKFGYEFDLKRALSITGLVVNTITTTTATGDWDDFPNALNYEYQVLNGTTVVQSGTVVPSTVNLTGLTINTAYTLKVRGILPSNGYTNWASITFNTAAV